MNDFYDLTHERSIRLDRPLTANDEKHLRIALLAVHGVTDIATRDDLLLLSYTGPVSLALVKRAIKGAGYKTKEQ